MFFVLIITVTVLCIKIFLIILFILYSCEKLFLECYKIASIYVEKLNSNTSPNADEDHNEYYENIIIFNWHIEFILLSIRESLSVRVPIQRILYIFFKFTLIPVSYTHLDVYKRQP